MRVEFKEMPVEFKEMPSKRSLLAQSVMEHEMYIQEERPQNSEVIERYFGELKKVRELSIVNLSPIRAGRADGDILLCYNQLMSRIESKYWNRQGNLLHTRIYECKFLRDYNRYEQICDHDTLNLKRVIADEINKEEHDEFFDNCREEFENEIERCFPLMIAFLQLDPNNREHAEIVDKVFHHNAAERKDAYNWDQFLEQIEKIHNNPIQDKTVLNDFIKEANGDEITSYNRRQKASETRTTYYDIFKEELSNLSNGAFNIFRNVSVIVVSYQVLYISMIFAYRQIT
jgi:hypothetical protein